MADINIDLIKEKCSENEALFADLEFPSDETSLFKSPNNMPEYHKNYPNIVWKRP